MNDLTTEMADNLRKMHKIVQGNPKILWPKRGKKLDISLCSDDERTIFHFGITSCSIEMKFNMIHRVYTSVVLARVDIEPSSNHSNPDGEIIACPHIHLYREGYGDKWAYPLEKFFPETSDAKKIAKAFALFCNIDGIPDKLYAPETREMF